MQNMQSVKIDQKCFLWGPGSWQTVGDVQFPRAILLFVVKSVNSEELTIDDVQAILLFEYVHTVTRFHGQTQNFNLLHKTVFSCTVLALQKIYWLKTQNERKTCVRRLNGPFVLDEKLYFPQKTLKQLFISPLLQGGSLWTILSFETTLSLKPHFLWNNFFY